MAGFSQDLPLLFQPLQSTSPQTTFQRLNTTSTHTSSSSSSEIDMMRNRILQMQNLATTEKEVNKAIYVSLFVLRIFDV
jgi:phage shock protein A